MDTGKCVSECVVSDIVSAEQAFLWCSRLAHTQQGNTVDLGGGSWGYTRYEPIGVCGGIGAWNYPIQSAGWKSAPACAAGNSMIFKPAQDTCLTALKLAEVFIDAGAPKGLFQVVLGGPSTGEKLVQNENIKKISFTGSRDVGKRILASGADQIKRTTLEL
eukprot:UN34627